MNGGGGKRDLRDVGVKEKEATLTIRKAAVICDGMRNRIKDIPF